MGQTSLINSDLGTDFVSIDIVDHPTPASASALKGKIVIQIDCGRSHSLCLTKVGGEHTEWIHHVLISRRSFEAEYIALSLKGDIVCRISCGSNYILAMMKKGHVETWRTNGKNQLLLDKGSSNATW
jgi:alpha-tubulin suppressor-like RCC1 family protein